MLVSLYSIAAGKSPGELTVADIERPDVVEFVKEFQESRRPLHAGHDPAQHQDRRKAPYGHFFLMPEDNLVSLYQGNEKAIAADGTEQPVDPVNDLVMIYPKEGSVLNSNPAGVVDAALGIPTNSEEAAREWIDFLREDEQQQHVHGRRLPTGDRHRLSVDERQFAEWGLDADQPRRRIEPGELHPAVLDRIIGSWGAVKKPAIVTFVVDVSGSMEGEPLEQVKDGLTGLLDAMAGHRRPRKPTTRSALVTFSDTIRTEIAPVAAAAVPLRHRRRDRRHGGQRGDRALSTPCSVPSSSPTMRSAIPARTVRSSC